MNPITNLIVGVGSSLLLVACGGCILGIGQQGSHDGEVASELGAGSGDSTSAGAGQAKPGGKPRVAVQWQERMEQLLSSRPKGSDAYGLFSEGGWADAGQIMIFGVSDDGHLALVDPAAAEITLERAMKPAEFAAIREATTAGEKLETLEKQAFDGLRFEYVHLRKTGSGSAEVVKRVFMNNPGAEPISKPHNDLIDAFQTLRARGR